MPEIVYTKEEIEQKLFIEHAPAFNFELDGPQLLKTALDRGFVRTKHGTKVCTWYIINKNYEGVDNA